MKKIIELKNVVKDYQDNRAVDDISLDVYSGEIFAFLGKNGAGKSSTINMICTLLDITQGEILVDGKVVGKEDVEIRSSIGVVFQENVLDDTLTVNENLMIRCKLYGYDKKKSLARVEQVLNLLEIQDIKNRHYGKLSGGQRRKVDIARGLLNEPKILILDEPSTGLDPHSRQKIWQSILQFNRELGLTIFFTTHYMEEVNFADRLAIIDKGSLKTMGTPSQIREKYSLHKLVLDCIDVERVRNLLEKEKYDIKDNIITVYLKETKDSIEILNNCLSYLDSFEVLKGTLDDAFINITGGELV